MDTEVRDFVSKILQIPTRVNQNKVFKLGDLVLLKCSVITDYLSVVYKSMPTSMRTARKKGMRASFRSFLLLDRLDKMFLSKKFPNNIGYAFIVMKELEELIDELVKMIPSDDDKLQKILEGQ